MNSDTSRSILFTIVIAVVALVAVTVGGSVVKSRGEHTGEPVGITVTGHSEIMAVPDTAYVSLGVATERKSSRQAVANNARIAQAITDAVKAQGVEAKDIQTRGYALQPTYR